MNKVYYFVEWFRHGRKFRQTFNIEGDAYSRFQWMLGVEGVRDVTMGRVVP